MAQTVVATWIPRLWNNQIWRITAEQRQHSKCYKNIGTTANILLIWIVVIRNLVHRFCWSVLLQSCFCFRWRNPLTVGIWHMFIAIAQPDTECWILPNYITCSKYIQIVSIPDAQNFYWKALAITITKLQYLYTKESFWWGLFNGNGWWLRIKSIQKLRPFPIFPTYKFQLNENTKVVGLCW